MCCNQYAVLFYITDTEPILPCAVSTMEISTKLQFQITTIEHMDYTKGAYYIMLLFHLLRSTYYIVTNIIFKTINTLLISKYSQFCLPDLQLDGQHQKYIDVGSCLAPINTEATVSHGGLLHISFI